MTVAALTSPLQIEPELPADAGSIEALMLHVFGPGRFAKTAERLRESGTCVAGFVAREGGRVVGSVRLWAVSVGETPALFLGPIAVSPDSRSAGLGADLVAACLEKAKAGAWGGVLLVGDGGYFQRFGFAPAPDARLPGPVDQRRVLWLAVNGESAVGGVRAT